ncbi:cupin domain-containing protein [Rufibacter roseus]|uniref:Cupin domain-containing protein n=1 Tax=Rufibacter roseus TaxID=1567108 RepID=A0ABW2DS91_9BACT|nr:cupin domain-containing protein [Rufibacter roseus]
MSIEKVNLTEKLGKFNDYWNPRIAGELNGQQVKLAKFQGDFIWHKHDHEDELFLVISGEMKMELRDKTVYVKPGEFIIIPRGVEHRPGADQEAHVLLFEPASVVNTGEIKNELTRENLEKI